MPTAISCPSCRRVLNLPNEVLNRLVQCPACKKQFHPAEAEQADFVRPVLPSLETARAAESPAASSSPAAPERGAPTARPVERRSPPAAPPPPASYDVRRSNRRGKRQLEDLCPLCQALVPPGVDICPECHAEFEPEDDDYRPWEQAGMERRDSEPHRGNMLLIMGIASIICSFFFILGCLWGIGVGTSVLGLALGGATTLMGRADLQKMKMHAMAREGHGITSGAMICGIIGLFLNLMALPAAIGLLAMRM